MYSFWGSKGICQNYDCSWTIYSSSPETFSTQTAAWGARGWKNVKEKKGSLELVLQTNYQVSFYLESCKIVFGWYSAWEGPACHCSRSKQPTPLPQYYTHLTTSIFVARLTLLGRLWWPSRVFICCAHFAQGKHYNIIILFCLRCLTPWSAFLVKQVAVTAILQKSCSVSATH